MGNFTAIGQMVTEARTLLDSIKGGAIRTMQTEYDNLKVSFQSFMTASQQQLDSFVTAQRGRVDAVLAHFDKSTSYVHSYRSGFPTSEDGDGKYHIVQLQRIKNNVTSLNPMIGLAFHGMNSVGSAMFMSLAQTHASYTGQTALIYKKGNQDVRFFVDRTNQVDAPIYVAVKNSAKNSASLEVKASSNAALEFQFYGAIADIPSHWEEIQKVNA